MRVRPAPAAAAAPQPAAQPNPQPAPSVVTLVVAEVEPAAQQSEPAATTASNADAATAATALIVSFRPAAAASPISLLPADEIAIEPTRSARSATSLARRLLARATCARPAGRIPLSQDCKQARAIAVLRAVLISAPSPEVRAAIDRVARVTTRSVEARPPPESKAAKKHPVARARPIVPFGHSGQGIINDGFNGIAGATSSPRLFALAAAPLRVPLPFRFARICVPSTRPHGVIAAPPTARPG